MADPKTVSEFLDEIYALEEARGVRCFRGEVNKGWSPIPSVMRNLRGDAERNIISELTLESPSEFKGDVSMFQKLVRAQHYGLPTRLLDVSLNPIVALYFACFDVDDSQVEEDASVLVFDFPGGRVKYADSDAISILCNLSRLSDDEKKNINNNIKTYKKQNLTAAKSRSQLNSTKEIKRLVQFVRAEKAYFKEEIDPKDFKRCFFVHPPKSNRRVVAQSGAFVVAGLLEYQKPENAASFKLHRINIPAKAKADILFQLDKININNRTMFPEIEFTSRYIKEKWTSTSNNTENDDILDDLF